ncbi:MAG TPA: 2-hydroxyacyl-CoA dehydratase, partial [Spirochaetes bacterium]|nr:2-hydroxyacyl-CoA dehydratase [Spirochaetota bacterium]
MDDYRHLFALCGFDSREMEAEEPRIKQVFEIVGLGAEDIQRAEHRIKTYLDTGLAGVRKLLRAWMLELFDLVLAKKEGRTVVYYGYPSIQGPGMAIKASSPDTLYVGCPDVVLCHTVGLMFDRLTPLLEAAEANGLPAGHGLCSLQQIRNGALALGVIPVPDLVTGSSYYCDMGSKADELLHQLYGQPSIYIDGCMDTGWGAYPDYTRERVEFFGEQIDKLFTKVHEIIGVETTAESMMKAMQTSRGMLGALGKLTLLMMADPMPISGVASGMAVNLAGASTGRSMTDGPDAVNTLCAEVERRVADGAGVVEKGAPRVMNFAQHLSDPAVTVMMEKAGLAVAASFVTVPPPKRDKTLQLDTVGQTLAEAALRGGAFHSTYGFARRWVDAVRALNLDGVIWGYQYNCRP